jgi:hypothetical protein
MTEDTKTGLEFPIFQMDVLTGDLFGFPDKTQFPKDYLRVCDLTEFAKVLSHVKDYEGNLWKHKIYCNYIMIDPLKRAFGYLVKRGLAKKLLTFDGCWNIRQSVQGTFKSMHSWGLAIDFNARSNGYGKIPSLSPEFVSCFAECGFEWGGLWRGRQGTKDYSGCDGMHFQLPWIRRRSGPLSPIPWVA